MSLGKIVKAIHKQNNFLITTHVRPEGDALGAAVGLCRLLTKLKKRAVVAIDDAVPKVYHFLPGINAILRCPEAKRLKNIDSFAVVDCADISRCGAIAALAGPGVLTLNIDHHISNSMFAKVNFVSPYASLRLN